MTIRVHGSIKSGLDDQIFKKYNDSDSEHDVYKKFESHTAAPKKTACPTLLMLRTQQVVDGFDGVERFDRHFDKHHIPVAHGAVP